MPVVTLGSYDPATYAPELTTSRGYPLPHPETATAREDVVKIALALLALDVDVAALVADLATKADAATVLSEAAIDGKIAAEISALIHPAPGSLNTLGELATALGDDPNFAATLAAQIAERPTAAAVTAQIAAATADGSVTLAKIAPAALSGLDDALVTGSPGAAGALAAWDAFGDLGAAPVASTAEMEAGTETALRAMSPSLIAAAITALGGGVSGDVVTLSNADDVQVFDTSGTWTKPVGAAFVLVECIGGGGSGVAAYSTGTSRYGGGGGGFARRLIAAAELGASETVVVGAGMAKVFETGKGGDSAFGAHVSAPGGHGGGYQYDSPSHPPSVPGGGGAGSAGSGRDPYRAHRGGGSIWGGAGGGGIGQQGGVSLFGGNGGASGVAGTAPGGGGGYDAAGANGRVTVKTWVAS